jgi:hypothetical protein
MVLESMAIICDISLRNWAQTSVASPASQNHTATAVPFASSLSSTEISSNKCSKTLHLSSAGKSRNLVRCRFLRLRNLPTSSGSGNLSGHSGTIDELVLRVGGVTVEMPIAFFC